MESNTGAEDATNSIMVVDAQIHNEDEPHQPDDINQLPAVPSKGPGRVMQIKFWSLNQNLLHNA